MYNVYLWLKSSIPIYMGLKMPPENSSGGYYGNLLK